MLNYTPFFRVTILNVNAISIIFLFTFYLHRNILVHFFEANWRNWASFHVAVLFKAMPTCSAKQSTVLQLVLYMV